MDLESLLNASLNLEKRIATDRALRKYFSKVWGESSSLKKIPKKATDDPKKAAPARQLALSFPAEMCELLEVIANATGKTPAQILEESFVNYYVKKLQS